jgi:hypothetical protein
MVENVDASIHHIFLYDVDSGTRQVKADDKPQGDKKRGAENNLVLVDSTSSLLARQLPVVEAYVLFPNMHSDST